MVFRSEKYDPASLESLLREALKIAAQGGDILMDHYKAHCADADYLDIESKADDSPVTAADKASHNHITAALTMLTPDVPIISEENKEHPDISGGLFWTVDPLDGTKGFINKNDHFYVKIALIEDGQPILGVIYEPVYQRHHFSMTGKLSYEMDKDGKTNVLKTRYAGGRGQLSTLFNGLHYNPDAYNMAREYLQQREIDVQALEHANGQCSKAFYMAVASGEADIYLDCGKFACLRDGNGFSWDYAPDALIVPNAGGAMLEIKTGKPPVFDRPTERMNAMVALGDAGLGKKLLPAMKNDCL